MKLIPNIFIMIFNNIWFNDSKLFYFLCIKFLLLYQNNNEIDYFDFFCQVYVLYLCLRHDRQNNLINIDKNKKN